VEPGRRLAAALHHEETAEALEGLSWAAWWLNDVAEIFAARERAYRLYHDRDDRRGAARVAICLAQDHFLRSARPKPRANQASSTAWSWPGTVT
jgi:hypothetical protein